MDHPLFGISLEEQIEDAHPQTAAEPNHELSFGYQYMAIFGVGAFGATLAGIILTHATPAVLFIVLAAAVVVAVGLGVYLVSGADLDGILRTQ